MQVISSLMLSLLVSIQATNAQETSAKSEPSTPTAPPSAGGNTTADAAGAMASAATQTTVNGATAVANTTGSAATNAANSTTAALVDDKGCGSASAHINACLSQINKALSGCAQTDDVCLCENYANLATCYAGCPSMSSQGAQYKSMSTQHCDVPGVADKVKAAANAKNSTSSTPSSSSSSDASTPKMSAKSAASNSFQLSAIALVTGFSAALAHLVA